MTPPRTLVFLCAFGVWIGSRAEAAPRIPTGKWVVDYADAKCFLSREYGSADNPLTLIFEPETMGDGAQLNVLKTDKSVDMINAPAVVSTDTGLTISTDLYSYRFRGKPLRRHSMGITRSDLVALASAKSFAIATKGKLNDEFAVPQLRSALNALEECRADLVATWGIPRDQQSQLETAAVAQNPGELIFRSSDYPSAAIDSESEGRVLARLRIDPNGKISSCDVLIATKSPALDQRTCQLLLRRARYVPAQNKSGKPMTSFVVQQVTWVLAD